MKFTDRAQTALWKTAEWFKSQAWKLGSLYHPANLKQKGLLASVGLLFAAALVLSLVLGWYWSREPKVLMYARLPCSVWAAIKHNCAWVLSIRVH